MIGRPEVGVLAVQGAFEEHGAALDRAGAHPRQVRTPAELDGIDGLVIPGGESTTVGLVAERSGLLPVLRELVVAGMPVFGTCAGMIMLARATTTGAQPLVGGLDIVVRRNAFGRQVRSFETDLVIPVLGDAPVPAVFIRAPWIEEAGPGIDILATVDGHGVAAERGSVLVTAFHPELTDDVRLHERFLEKVRVWRTGSGAVSAERGASVRSQ
jgi:5'-phosphate synthase pdxT subunit